MEISFCFRVVGEFSGRRLWSLIRADGVNILDTDAIVWIYGKTSFQTLTKVIETCCVFGDIDGDIRIRR